MTRWRQLYDHFLEIIAAFLMVAVTAIVVLGFVFRWLGAALVWYDEIASISLAWLTYFGAALAASRGSHLGFAGMVNAMPATWRVAATLGASTIGIIFFALLAVMGAKVFHVIAGLTLVSLPNVQQQWVVIVIPIASVLFIIAELLRLPDLLREARRGPLIDAELKEALGGNVDLVRRAEERTP